MFMAAGSKGACMGRLLITQLGCDLLRRLGTLCQDVSNSQAGHGVEHLRAGRGVTCATLCHASACNTSHFNGMMMAAACVSWRQTCWRQLPVFISMIDNVGGAKN